MPPVYFSTNQKHRFIPGDTTAITAKALASSGQGFEMPISIGASWTQLVVSWNWALTGATKGANLTNVEFFAGLCTSGKGFKRTGDHCWGHHQPASTMNAVTVANYSDTTGWGLSGTDVDYYRSGVQIATSNWNALSWIANVDSTPTGGSKYGYPWSPCFAGFIRGASWSTTKETLNNPGGLQFSTPKWIMDNIVQNGGKDHSVGYADLDNVLLALMFGYGGLTAIPWAAAKIRTGLTVPDEATYGDMDSFNWYFKADDVNAKLLIKDIRVYTFEGP